MDSRLEAVLAELRQELEAIYGPRLVKMLLYGSHARGDADEGSDVDVLVVLKGPVQPGVEIERSGDFLAALSLEHDVVLSTFFIDEDRYLYRHGPLLRNVRREGVEI